MSRQPNEGPYAWMRRFAPSAAPVEDEPWLERLAAAPSDALDSLMRGEAHLTGMERSSACEALMGLMGDLPDDAPEWRLLDTALCVWLRERREADDTLIDLHGGLAHFIREVSEGFRAAWRLELPLSSAWIRENLFDLVRWADAISMNSTFDLAHAVLVAGAHVQRDGEYRFLWLRTFKEAATPRRAQWRDAAWLGVSLMPSKDGGPSQDIVVGLALWASNLPPDERYKSEVVDEWQSLKALFPRGSSFWRKRFEALLEDARFGGHPFLDWLRKGDPDLTAKPVKGQPKRAPLLPPNVSGQVKDLNTELKTKGFTDSLWVRMQGLLDQLENYADATGESYNLVTSCTSIASAIRPYAPGNALILARRALLWAPSDGHAWSVRGEALEDMGRQDLAKAVLWEGRRRAPASAAFANQLALLLVEEGQLAEAESLLAKAVSLSPSDAPVQVELARLRWLRGRGEDAVEGLHGVPGQSALYNLGTLLIAEGRLEAARQVAARYRLEFSADRSTSTLERLLAAGVAGIEEVRNHLSAPRQRKPVVAVEWDRNAAEAVAAIEEGEAPRLSRLSVASEADLLFNVEGGRRRAQDLVDGAIRSDRYDAYAHLVKALGDDRFKQSLRADVAGRFLGVLPIQLAAMPGDASRERWEDLARRFSENIALVDLVRLERGQADDAICQRLLAWTELPSRWDEGWTEFLKKDVAAHLKGEGRVPLSTLVHDALLQVVDVGWDAAPVAA